MKLLKFAALLTTAAIMSCTLGNQDTSRQQKEKPLSEEKEAAPHNTGIISPQDNSTRDVGDRRVFRRTVTLDFESETTVTEYPPGNLQEMPQNIVEHLENKGIAAYYSNDIYGFSRSNLVELQKYKDGKRKFFPQKEVDEAINSMADHIRISYHYNDIMCTDSLQNVLYELTDIAVNLVPDINLMAGCCSQDHRIGFLDYLGSYAEGYFCYSIIYKVAEGKYKAYTLDIVDKAAPLTKIRKIAEGEGETTYIISAEELYCETRACYTPFALYVVVLSDNGTVRSYSPVNSDKNIEEWLATFRKISEYAIFGHEEILFNPNNLSWEICEKNNNVYKKINGTKTLRLTFPNSIPTLILE